MIMFAQELFGSPAGLAPYVSPNSKVKFRAAFALKLAPLCANSPGGSGAGFGNCTIDILRKDTYTL
jgi:hypothetical protein